MQCAVGGGRRLGWKTEARTRRGSRVYYACTSRNGNGRTEGMHGREWRYEREIGDRRREHMG